MQEVLQGSGNQQTATSHMSISDKLQKPILWPVRASYLVNKPLHSWLFLLGSHRFYTELIQRKQRSSYQNSLLNTYSFNLGEKSNHYIACQVQKQENLNADKNICYQLMAVTISCSSLFCLSRKFQAYDERVKTTPKTLAICHILWVWTVKMINVWTCQVMVIETTRKTFTHTK